MKPWLKYLCIAIVILLVSSLTYGYQKFSPLIHTGTGMVAHQICSCLYVSKRELQSCLDDRWPNVQAIGAEPTQLAGAPAVEANGFIVTRTASYEPGFGCTLQD